MKSAGYGEPTGPQGPGGYGGYGGYGGNQQPGGGIPAPGGFGSADMPRVFTGSGGANNSNLSFKATVDTPTANKLASRQLWISGGQAALNTIGQGIEMFLQHDVATQKLSLMSKYYDTVGSVDYNRQQVALRQLTVQSEGIQAEKEVAIDTNRTKVKLGTVEAQLQASLARISEDGRNRRTELFIANRAFQAQPDARDPYSYGVTT